MVVERKPRQLKPCKVSITLPDGKLFEGNFVDDKLDEQINGKGTLTYPSGRNYNGDWKNGVFYGQGTYTSPDVSTYVGEWKDGNKWNVKRTRKDGTIISEYLNGKQQ